MGDGTSGKRYLYDGLSRVISDADVVASSPPPPNCTGDPPPIVDEYGNSCVNTGGTTWQVVSSVQFAYDSVDNRTDKGGSYLVGNRIANFDGCSYTTDLDGNVTARTCGTQTVTFFWSAESRLDSLTTGGQRVAFKYDAGGRLIRKDVNGVAQSHFLWDGGNLLAELNGVGTASVAEYSYFPGADNPHAVVVGGQEYHPQVDGLGNVIALTDNAQSVQRTYSYDAWGTLTGGTDTKPFANIDRVRFKGALWLGPEVDLYYMRSRWYEPKSGRFLSEDPIGLAGGLNPYVFAGDDPVNGRDPTGLTLCVDAVPWSYVGGDGSVTFLGWQIVRGPYDCGGGGGGGGKGGGGGGGAQGGTGIHPKGLCTAQTLAGKLTVDASIAPDATKFLDFAGSKGARLTWPGFRSVGDQGRLYVEQMFGLKTDFPVAPPGTSAHGGGFAWDLSLKNVTVDNQINIINLGHRLGFDQDPRDAVHFQFRGWNQSSFSARTQAMLNAELQQGNGPSCSGQ